MPRPRPAEQLFNVSIRLTRNQMRKMHEKGGAAWLRKLISRSKWDSQVEHWKAVSERNKTIVASALPNKELAVLHHLSVKRIQQIKREHKNA